MGRVEHHQLAGVLADGRLRDFEQLRGYDFATWCRGEATRWGGDTVMPYGADIAVEIAGVAVIPGDLVYADAAGAVVIPADSLSRVLDEAEAVEREDAEAALQIQDERGADERGKNETHT
ncbi:RraA family protein [Nocardia rhamnosiphila]|uniref:RraA family protein n=1 Tax=Nocardia rhamnosiphila TaxID=426716 RepID=UPI0033C34086